MTTSNALASGLPVTNGNAMASGIKMTTEQNVASEEELTTEANVASDRKMTNSENVASGDAVVVGTEMARDRRCAWCFGPIPEHQRSDARFCRKRCRQASWRFAVRHAEVVEADRPRRFAYADPPYPGNARYYPEHLEVNHEMLVDELVETYPDGWALSTSARALRDVLMICPDDVRVCAWFRGARHTRARRAVMSWEPLIVWRGRPHVTSVVQDLADALVAVGRFRAYPGAIVGMKPPAFAEWMFGQLGAARGDALDDLYPGSGANRAGVAAIHRGSDGEMTNSNALASDEMMPTRKCVGERDKDADQKPNGERRVYDEGVRTGERSEDDEQQRLGERGRADDRVYTGERWKDDERRRIGERKNHADQSTTGERFGRRTRDKPNPGPTD